MFRHALVVFVLAGACGAKDKDHTDATAAQKDGAPTEANRPPPPAPRDASIPEVVAEIGGQPVTWDEVFAEAGGEIVQAELAMYEARENAVESIVIRKLVDAEAAKRGLTGEALLQAEVESKVTPVTDAEIDAFYAENQRQMRGPIEQMRPQIAQYLQQERAQGVVRALVEKLRADAGVKTFLPKYRIEVDPEDSPRRGSSAAPVQIVEFSDFQCPYCRKLADALKAAADQHGNVRIVFRHYPMDASCNRAVEGKFHEFACGAAKAALCAEAQGRFWAMHDVMFENQRALSPAELSEHARTAGLDTAAFARCLEAPETAARLERDLARAESLKLKGTPSWFVNGLAYVGARSVDELLAIFERTAPGKARGAGGSDAKAADHHP